MPMACACARCVHALANGARARGAAATNHRVAVVQGLGNTEAIAGRQQWASAPCFPCVAQWGGTERGTHGGRAARWRQARAQKHGV